MYNYSLSLWLIFFNVQMFFVVSVLLESSSSMNISGHGVMYWSDGVGGGILSCSRFIVLLFLLC